MISSGLFVDTGGPPVVIANLVENLTEEGHKIKLVTAEGKHHSRISKLQYQGLNVTFYKVLGRFRFTREWSKFDPRNFDLVWIHGMWLFPNILGTILALLYGKKILLTPHGVLSKTMIKKSKTLKLFIGSFELLNLKLNRNTSVHFLSAKEKEVSIVKPRNSFVIPNFVNVEIKDSIRKEKFACYVARIAKIKGIEDILSSSFGQQIDVYGGRNDRYSRSLDLGKCSYKGELMSHEVGSTMSQYMFYCLPSYGEGLPTSAIEAALSGCVLIVTEECNLDMFVDGVSCIQMKIGKEGLETALNRAKTMTDDQYRNMRESSLKIAKQYFSRENVIRQYRKIL